jgi:hypothetical protein
MKGDGFIMRKVAAVILVMLMITTLASASFAGGGPPTNFKKGVFLDVDKAAKTAVLQILDSEDTITVTLGEEINPEQLPLNKKMMVTLEDDQGQKIAKSAEVMFLDLTLSKFIALMVVGLVGGLLSGFIGSGGAFVLTPSMMSPLQAICATSSPRQW